MKIGTKFLAGALVAGTMLASQAQAQGGITFTGTTAFCFGAAPGTPVCPTFSAASATNQQLTLANGSFTTTTNAAGFAAIGGSGVNLGVASLNPVAAASYDGQTVQLRATFMSPLGTGQGTFSGTLFGAVQTNPTSGGINIVFSPASLTGTLGGSPAGSTYTLNVNNISLTPGQTNVEITGSIVARVTSTVPEPSTYALMATGLVGLFGVARRRRTA